MTPWIETAGVTAIALFGIFLGRKFSKLKSPYWAAGYFAGLALIGLLVMTRFASFLIFVPPFSWVTAGRARFVVLSLAVTMGLATPLSRLPYKFEKAMVWVLMAVVVVWSSILPFLVPALIKNELLSIDTLIDSNGICYQTKDYTCGPAAAVTALGQLGLAANEGEIAVLAHTSPIVGTLPACLSKALQDRYEGDGLNCQYRRFESVAQLRDAGITLAVVKDTFLTDHCIAVLGVSDNMVIIADPVTGRRLMSHKQFERIWRFCGIVLKRDAAQKAEQQRPGLVG